MDGTTGVTPVIPMGDGGLGGSSALIWIFALLILAGGGFGGGLFGGNGNVNSLNADMQRGFDQQNTMYQTGNILNAVTNGTAQTIAASTQNAANAITAIKDGNASLIREFGNVETALTGVAGKMQECCCNTLRAIDSVNYNGAINTASINANTTAQVQKVLDAITANRMSEMESQINALQLQAATANVLRFPNSWAFAGGVFPPVQTTTA